jgi:hypothetical protein
MYFNQIMHSHKYHEKKVNFSLSGIYMYMNNDQLLKYKRVEALQHSSASIYVYSLIKTLTTLVL